MKVFNNITDILRDDMATTITRGSKVSIAAACFSIYAYNELKKQIDVLQTKICKESQLNKQVQMNAGVKRLKKELEEINGRRAISKNSKFVR